MTLEYKLSFKKDLARVYQNPTPFDVSCKKSSLEDASGKFTNLTQEIKHVELMLITLKVCHAHLNTYIQQNT